VGNCVVAGHYKPAIVLFVEPLSVDPSHGNAVGILKEQILARHAPFNASAFIHERLQSKVQIVAVPRGTLPRTTVSFPPHNYPLWRKLLTFSPGKRKYSVSYSYLKLV
jgi:hypothetical protein